jgi:hypothetical protein
VAEGRGGRQQPASEPEDSEASWSRPAKDRR